MIPKNKLKALFSNESDPAVSLYMPTHKAGPGMREDPIRLKNLLRDVEKRLPHRPTADRILEPAWRLIGREREWQYMENGLAMFLSEDTSEIIKLPMAPGEQVVVQQGFYIKPLLRMLDDGQRFYILILDRKDPRLLLCSRESFDRVEHPVMEETFAELLARTELPADLGFHSGSTSQAQGGMGAVRFHSHGNNPEDYKKIELDQFIQGVARATDDALKEDNAPLVVAGEPEMVGMLRSHIRYGHLVDEGVVRSGNGGSDATIHAEALKLVIPRLDGPRDGALQKLAQRQNGGPNAVAFNHDEILRDAREGRVETLLLADDAALWGRLFADDRSRLLPEGSEGAVDLADRMATRTLAHGGTVFMVARGDLPKDSQAAAILRY